MDIATLQAESRTETGTNAARRLRRQGKLPAIIYGHGEAPEAVSIGARDLGILLQQGVHVLELKVGGQGKQVLIKDVQFDHLGTNPTHVDFTRIDLTERIRVSVPLEFRGTPQGLGAGGVFEHPLVDIEIECLATQIPESIRVNVAGLKIGDLLHVRDVQLPEGVEAVTPAEAIVASVRMKAAEVEAAAPVEGEEPQQPEIIGRKEKEAEPEAEEK